jgi:hypothetical protein
MRFVIGIFILVLFFSCKKEQPQIPDQSPSVPVHNMSNDLRKWKFKVNSYWIYEDQVTLQTDSAYIDLITHNGPESFINNTYEVYGYRLRHTVTADTDHFFFGGGGAGVYRGVFDPRRSFVYVDYTIPSASTYYPQDSVFRSDSLFVYDRYYQRVVSIHLQGEICEDSLKTTYYSNSDYGLLRKDVFNTNGTLKNKWMLKSKNVIR